MFRLLLILIPCFVWSGSLPCDPQVLHGQLDNGLTYYIRPHANPHEKISLRLAVKVGSLHEEDHEIGIAHFVEHLVFRGTAKYGDREVIHFLRSIGAPLGADLNAMTSYDSTIYKLEVSQVDHIDQSLEVLSELAFHAQMTPEGIESERNVVVNENQSHHRVNDQLGLDIFKQTFPTARYSHRIPAWDVDCVKKSNRTGLYSFYKKWYLPQRMAVIVVGDIDPHQVLEQVKDHFASEPYRECQGEEPDTQLEMLKGASLYQNIVDCLPDNRLWVIWKALKGVQKTATVEDRKEVLLTFLNLTILNQRLSSMVFQKDAPVISARIGLLDWRRSHWFIQSDFSIYPGRALIAYKQFMQQIGAAKAVGYTQKELDEARKILVRNIDSERENAHLLKNSVFIDKCEHHFLYGEPFMDRVDELDLDEKLLKEINLYDLQTFFQTGQIMRYLFGNSKELSLEGYEEPIDLDGFDPHLDVSLLELRPVGAPGKLKTVKLDLERDIEYIKLSNGMGVILKPSDQGQNTLSVDLRAPKGILSLDPSEYHSAKVVGAYTHRAGYANLDGNQFRLATNKMGVGLSLNLGNHSSEIHLSSRGVQIEELFQVLRAVMSAPRSDPAVWEDLCRTTREQIAQAKTSMRYGYVQGINSHYYSEHPALGGIDLSRASPSHVERLYRRFFTSPADFVMVVVGDFSSSKVKRMLKRYIANIPLQKKRKVELLNPIEGISNRREWRYRCGVGETAQVQIFQALPPFDPSLKVLVAFDGIDLLIRKRLERRLRNELSKVYSVSSTLVQPQSPSLRGLSLRLSTTCLKGDVDEVKSVLEEELYSISREGFSEEDFSELHAALKANYARRLNQNELWIQHIFNHLYYKIPITDLVSQSKRLSLIRPNELNPLYQSFFSSGGRLVAIWEPSE